MSRRGKVFLGITAVFLMNQAAFAAGDAKLGKAAAALCAGCHGPAGISPNPLWPNLAGQKPDYLAKQLRAFRDDSRKDPLMTPMAKTIGESDIDNIAAYFSSLSAQ